MKERQKEPERNVTERLIQAVRKLPPDQQKRLLEQLYQSPPLDQRKSSRYPFFETIDLSGPEGRKTDFIKDISKDGLFLETDIPFNVGDHVNLILQSSIISKPVEIEGEVVRQEDSGIGIQFSRCTPDFLKVLPPPKTSQLETFRYNVSESIKVYLQERLSNRLYRKVLDTKWRIRQALIPFRRIRYYGHEHFCPVCGSHLSKFIMKIVDVQENARCPVCRCLERHRLDWIFFQRKTNLFDGCPKRMLHVAPENVFAMKFKKISYLNYITADLNNPKAMCNLDVTKLPFGDDRFDVIYCSHVLEHVPDDRKAIREFYRVTKKGGWALLQVPITAKHTIEDPTIEDPFERKRLFGQIDHVRRYGPDYAERLKEAGYEVNVYYADELLENERDFYRLGIQKTRMVFFCRKT